MPTRTFRGTIDSDWNTLGNWLELAVPTVADDVVFDALSPACTLSAAGNCLTLDCTGFAATITPGANTVTVAGTVFKLVAGCWVVGTALIDFTAVAGTTDITSAANTLYSVRCGNGGAGGTFRLLDALAVALDLDCVRGTFNTNTFNVTLGRDLLLKATMAAAGFLASSGTHTVGRDFVMNVASVYSAGTSTLKLIGSGKFLDNGGGVSYLTLYNLQCGFSGNATKFAGAPGWGGNSRLTVNNDLSIGPDNLGGNFDFESKNFQVSQLWGNLSMGTGASLKNLPAGHAFYAHKAVTYQGTITGSNVLFMGYASGGVGRTVTLNGNLSISGSLTLNMDGAPFGNIFTVNYAGFVLSVGTTISNGTAGQDWGWKHNIGTGQLNVTGNASLLGMGQNWLDRRSFTIGATGSMTVGGNVTFNKVGALGQTVSMAAGAVFSVGGNWDSSLNGAASVFYYSSQGTVRFTAAGAFTITTVVNELWPILTVSGGGTISLPNGFNCYDINITAGLVTAGNPFTVRNSLVNNGTFTGSANMFVGSSFVNTGILVMAGTNITATGNLVSLSGVNPVTLTMPATCLRLQLLTAMNITTFVIQDRAVPAVVQYLAGGTYNIGTINSQVVSTDGTVQFISSVAGTQYNWRVTAAITSIANIWPRDNNAAASAIAPVGNLTNKDLGNNTGWTLYFPAFVRLISDDPGQDLLADASIGSMQYCWFAATSQAALAALAAAFAAGANNWHRKTNLPFILLDNLNKGTIYFVGLGMIDDWGRRYPPNVGAGDFTTMTAISGESSFGGGGAHNISVLTQFALQG